MRLNSINGNPVSGKVDIPRSKPHMQRALVFSLLTKEKTTIKYPSWSSETEHLLNGLQQFGLIVIKKTKNELVLKGVGKDLKIPDNPVMIDGSGNMCRIIIAISLIAGDKFEIHGNPSMIGRPLDDFLDELVKSNFEYTYKSENKKFKLEVKGCKNLNSEVTIKTDKASQFFTALMMVAPLFNKEIKINRENSKMVSESYIEVTSEMMKKQGIQIEEVIGGYSIKPGEYSGGEIVIPSDFTSLSYIFEIVLIASDSKVTIPEFYPSFMRAEKKFFSIMNSIGLKTEFNDNLNELVIYKERIENVNLIIDAIDIPTVIPTLIAMSPFISGSIRIHGASHVDNHKTRRVKVMIDEMRRMGFNFSKFYQDKNVIDGFSTHGPQKPVGTNKVVSKGDHRNFMSLLIASMGTENPADVEGENLIHASYPAFLDNLKTLGLTN